MEESLVQKMYGCVCNYSKKIAEDLPNTSFFEHADVAEMLPDRYDTNAEPRDYSGTFYNDFVKAKYGASAQFHNWTCILIDCLKKYQCRGIEVIDAPMVKNDNRVFCLIDLF